MAATKKTSSKTTSGAAKGPVDKALKATWLTFSGIEPEMVKKVGAELAKG